VNVLDVAVNLTWLAPGRVGGSEEYLTRQLAGLPADGSLVVTIHAQPALAAAHPELAERFEIVPLPFRRDSRAARIAVEHSWLARRTRRASLVHHGGGTVPVVERAPVLLTVHDLQYVRFPQYFSRARREYLGRMLPRSVRSAQLVAVPTEYVRSTVVDTFGVAPDRVVVVPHGVPDVTVGEREVARVRDRYGIGDRPFLVYPAVTHPHKGHRVLVDALRELDDEVVLVLPGGTGTAEAELGAAADRAGVADRVVRCGRVPDADRDALVAGAAALVFPSEYEGFGAPLVEAMVLDTPVVCSSHPAVREVVGDAAIVVDEPSPTAWAEAVTSALSDPGRLVDAGRRRRVEFTSEASGRALLDAYRRAAVA
jgi:glycosyltransferase involved in cell wall biosynthesis